MKDLNFDISGYKTKSTEYPDKEEENVLSNNVVSSKQDSSVLIQQVKSLKQHVNVLQSERDQLERKYKEALEEDNEVYNTILIVFNCNVTKKAIIFSGRY